MNHTEIHHTIINRKITEDVNALIAIYSVHRNGYHKNFGKYSTTDDVALAIYFINNPPYIAFSGFKRVNSPEEIKNMSDEEFLKKFQPNSSHERKILKNIIRQKIQVKT